MGASIHLLGGFRIDYGDGTVIDAGWRPAKAAALVKILALQPGRTMHRDQLIDLLWPEADAEAGGSSFYKNLHHLRAAFRNADAPGLIQLHRGAVSLSTEPSLDVDEFRDLGRQALASGDISVFERALAVCTGDLLPADLYEPWTEPHREELRSFRQRLQLELAERLVRRRRIDDAVARYQEVIAASPVSEEAHRGLMRAYGLAGHRDLALAQYESCRDALASELDAEPSAETEALADELRRTERLPDVIGSAIAAPLDAAEGARRRHDWIAAAAGYREAIERLHTAGSDDEREAQLWLRLSGALSAAGSTDVAETSRRAAALAERAGALDIEARALVQFQDAADRLPNNHAGHRESAELIAAALERCPPGASVSKALLLAAGARPAAAAARTEDEQHITGRVAIAGNTDAAIEQRLREAVAIARAVAHDEALAYALSRLRLYITSPDTLDERLAISRELVTLRELLRSPVSEFDARVVLHEDLLESGDIDGARIEARALRRIGEDIGIGGYVAAGDSFLATHMTADGELRQALSILLESRSLEAQHGATSNSAYRFGIQLMMIRWHQGRITELYDGYRRAVDLAPRQIAPRASLALICAESDRLDEARSELAHLAESPISSIPKDFSWYLAVIAMSRAAIATGDVPAATALYAALQPYAERNASTAGAVSFGSASLFLANLSAFLGDLDAAEQHYEHALAFNVRTRQRIWAAHARADYARALIARGRDGDVRRASDLARVARGDAAEIGMPALAAALDLLPLPRE